MLKMPKPHLTESAISYLNVIVRDLRGCAETEDDCAELGVMVHRLEQFKTRCVENHERIELHRLEKKYRTPDLKQD